MLTTTSAANTILCGLLTSAFNILFLYINLCAIVVVESMIIMSGDSISHPLYDLLIQNSIKGNGLYFLSFIKENGPALTRNELSRLDCTLFQRKNENKRKNNNNNK